MRILPTLLVLALSVTAARADERILSFQSDIEIQADSSMTVTETIRVRAEGKQIKRGIYRDFPTRYRDRVGNRVKVGFDVIAVRRNGKPENHKVEPLSNGKRVRIGRKEKLLDHGEHTYEISYRTTRQLGYFEKHDELYWNVTGNGWAFPIDEARARVGLPGEIDPGRLTLEGYTGPRGSKATDLETSVEPDGHATFKATRILGREEGLTLVLGFPKDIVREPTKAEKARYILRDNRTFLAALSGLAVMLLYYTIAWIAVGRDPERGTIIPRFVPPQKISPAAARYVMKMGYDNKCFAACLINLAVRKCVTLEEEKRVFTVKRKHGADKELSSGEKKVLSRLVGSRRSIELKQANHSTIRSAVEKLKKALEGEHAKHSFITNGRYLVPGVILLLLTLAAVVSVSGNPEITFFAVWLSFWTLGVVMLLRQVITQWRLVLSGGQVTQVIGALFITLFAFPFLAAEIFVGVMFARGTSALTVLTFLVTIPLTILFHHLLKAPTRQGRKLMDALEGFKQYLGVAEEDRLAALHPPEKTPALFEAYLPYALALDVEQQWAEKFAGVLDAATRDPGSSGYHPAWYSSTRTLSYSSLAGSIGSSLSSAVSSSSTAPGSSSGGGGGGSSGGGGGGGGGGGW